MKGIMKFSLGKIVSSGLILLAALAAATLPAPAASCTPPPAGIIGWWKGDGNAADSAATNNGVAANCSYTNGVDGLAFSFDPENLSWGTYSGIQIADQPAYALTNSLTIEAWVRPRGDGYYIFFRGDNRPGLDPYGLAMQGNNTVLFIITDANGNGATVGTTIAYNAWTHLAATLDGNAGTMNIYTNGVLAAQTVTTVRPFGALSAGNSPGIGIGNLNDGFNNFPFIGDIDELALYNRALTAAEVQAIYNAGSAGKCVPTSVGSTGVPAIFNFSPTVGTNGAVVAIAGTNFSANAAADIVYFGAVRANILAASPNSLIITVPTGATFAPITVTVNGLIAFSSQPFEPTFAGSGSIGPSSFAPGFNLGAGNTPAGTAIGDLDGDGKPDLVLINAHDNSVWIYQNIGTNATLAAASFAPPVILPLAGNPLGLALADVDGDGRLDVLVTDSQNNNVSVFQNLCVSGGITTNSFAARVDFPVGQQPFTLAAMDLNGDGRVDIVTVNLNDNTFSVLQNLGSPAGITTNSFAAHVDIATGLSPEGVAIGDLDGDGRPDIAVANIGGNSVSVFRNLNPGGAITTNSFAPRVDFTGAGGGEAVAIGDIDGDGKPDLLISGYVPQVLSVFQNTSVPGSITTNSFGPRIDFPTGGRAHRIALGDLDGDGKPDIAVSTELPSQLVIFKNLSSPGILSSSSLAAPVAFPAGWNPNCIAIGDLDGDGRLDIFVANDYDGDASVYQNTTPFGTAPVITVQPTNQTVTVGGTATFAGLAQGAAPLTYQWAFNGTNISGATNSSLTLLNVQLDQAGNYALLATNSYGSAVSSNVLLSVFVPAMPPIILSQTPSQLVLRGSSATFSVTVSGSDPLNYFWSRNGALIPNATNASYTLFNAQLADPGSKFSCLVTNAYGSAASSNMTLKVIDSTVANDLCSGAILITNASSTNVQSTLGATAFGDPVPDCVDGFGHGVWYQFTAPVAGILEVDTFGSDFDTGLAVYTGTCGALTEAACDDDTVGVGATSQVSLPTTPGMTYFILAGGYGSDAGNLVLHLHYFTPPAFDVQPTNTSVVVSSNAIFNPTLSGTLPMSFQWFFNNSPLMDGGRISGSTNSVLNIASVQTNDGGNYFLVASNFVGVTTSSVAVLTPVILPPVLTLQPTGQSVLTGSNVTFTAAVDGTPPYSFQWSLNGSPLTDDGVHIVGSATTSLSISNLTTSDAGSYTLTVTNLSGATNSAAAVLTVLVPPVVTLNPVGRSVPPGLPTTFNAVATGIPAPSYQWQFNGTNISDANSASYLISSVGTNNLGFYQVVANNSVGSVTSVVAQLTFGPVAAWGRNLNNESLPPPNLSNVVAIAATSGAGFAVRTDGSIVPWGATGMGNVTNFPASATNVVAISTAATGASAVLRADGVAIGWNGPTLPNLTNIVSVAMGGSLFGLALHADGTVTGWGITPYSLVPTSLNSVTAIACGFTHSLALRNDGTVVAWGAGAGTNVPTGLAGVAGIAAGLSHSLALKTNGTVVAWGSGTGTNVPAGLTNVVAVYASAQSVTSGYSYNFSLAIRANGTVVAWGDSPNGETNPPAALNSLFTVAACAAPLHGLALVNDGRPQILQPPVGLTAYTGRNVTLQASAVGAAPLSYQWLLNGTNILGATNASLALPNIQLANAGNYQLLVSNAVNTAISLPAPVNVIVGPLTILTQISASPTLLYQGGKFSVGGLNVQGSGPVNYQWFFAPTNKNYAVIPGATNTTLTMDPALAVSSGNYYLAASNLVGGVTSAPVNVRVLFAKAWGYGAVSNPPVNVTNAVAIANGGAAGLSAGDYFALGSDGKLTSWANYIPLYGETNVSALSNSIVTAIAAGYEDSLALKSDGTVYAWGYGVYGETNVPAALNGVTAIACGPYHDLALKSDGTVVGWGGTGQFNYGQTTNNPAATNVVAIAAGTYHSLALRADGSVVSWGYTPDLSTIPLAATNMIAIAAGGNFNVALRANGTVIQWGNGILSYPLPVNVSNIVAISAAGTHVTALKNDGTVVTWGNEYIGVASNNIPSDLANVIAITSGGDHDLALFGTRAPAFTVQPWNRTFPATATTNLFLAGKCAGVQPVRYQWQLNSTNVPGATNDVLILTNNPSLQYGLIRNIPTGAYQLIASNAYGVVASKYVKVSSFIPLGDALDATNLTWTTSGNAQWYGQTNYVHAVSTGGPGNSSAARSGGIGALQETILQTTFATNVAGNVSFWWKVSSEQDFDILEFRINGVTQASISGEVDWTQASFPLAAGTNVLMWRYSKDASFDAGLDAAFVDQFAFVAAPIITKQPGGVVANLGNTVSLSVIATGAAPMSYQWFRNGSPINGAISSTYTKLNVARAQDGTYSVIVTNLGGVAISSNAVLMVHVPQLLGSPTLLPNGTFQLTSTDVNGGLLTAANLTNFSAQASTDLVNWVTLPNVLSLTNGMLLLQDSSSSNFTTRYYRLVEQ
jgi:alpha-tubulin suppressor-like RCC1 family protein